MMTSVDILRRLARELADASTDRRQIEPLSDRYPALSLEEAYAIQALQLDELLAAGDSLIGHKIGLTSLAMQKQLGVASPDCGHILHDMWRESGATLNCDSFIQARIEPEIAIILDANIPISDISADVVAKATRAVAPALEVIDSRIRDWRIALIDTVADNASSCRIVVGDHLPWRGEPDLRGVHCSLLHGGDIVATGTGDAVLGNPFEAVAWLGRTLAKRGTQLLSGQIIMPGSLTSAVRIKAGDKFTAEFEGLGAVSAAFT